MATPVQIIQSLELTRSLLGSMTKTADEADIEKMYTEASKILEAVRALAEPPKTPKPEAKLKPEVHPIDTLLKNLKKSRKYYQGDGVQFSKGRYKQVVQIYDELTAIGVKFLSVKLNQYVTWFPLDFNGNKTAALYLAGSGEWVVEPLSEKANGELTGEWEGFDLTEFMDINCPEFDQDEY